MNCPYCQAYMLRTFSCSCTPDLLVCFSCSNIQCHKCSKQLKLTPQPKRCEICSVKVPAHRIFMSSNYNAFCVQCCFKSYTKALSQKKNVVSFETRYLHRKQVPLSQIKIFLQKFCVKCHKTIENYGKKGKNQNSQSEQQKDKKYYCETCYKQQTTQIPKLQPKDVAKQQQIHHLHKKNEERINNGFMHEREQKHFQQKSVVNKQEQQRKCLVCDKTLSKTKIQLLALSKSDLSLCNVCQHTSKFSQSIYQKNKQKHQVYSKQKGQEIKINKNMHQPASLTSKQKQLDQRQKRENARNNISESIVLQKEVLHKPDLPQIPIYEMDIKWIDDSQFVTCQICSIQVEKDCSAIMPQLRKPICRSCYSDQIQKLNRKMAQRNSPKKMNNYLGQTNTRKDEAKQKYNYLDEGTQAKTTNHAVSPSPTKRMDLKPHASQNRRGVTPSLKNLRPQPRSQPTAMQKRKQLESKSYIQSYPLSNSVYSDRLRQCPRCRTKKIMSDKYRSGDTIICIDCKGKQTRQIQQKTRLIQLNYI